MLVAASRAAEGEGDACLVVIAHGRKVEAWVVHDVGSRAEHVADWHLDGMVVGLCVAPVEERGFLVTSASDVGVGWSWVESSNWTVVGTQFQEISPDPHPSEVPAPSSPRASAAATATTTSSVGAVESKAQDMAADTLLLPQMNVNMHSSQGSICFLRHAGVNLISLEHRVFLTCIVTTFNQAMRVATALCFATELGYASAGRGAAPYRQLLFSQDRNPSSTLSGGSGGGGGVSVSNSFAGSLRDSQHFSSKQPIASGLGASINRGENDRCVVVVRQETLSELNDTVVMEVKSVIHDRCALRWCELECEGVPDGYSQGQEVSVNVLGVRIHTEAGRAHLAAQAGKTQKTLRSDHSKDNTGGLLRVIWELVLPPGASWCTEPYNNDGRDNRKLLYVALPTGSICVYNVNGLVATFRSSTAQEACCDMSSCGTIVGVMVQRLPITDEARRLVIAATTSGKYLEIQLDDLWVFEDEEGSALEIERQFTTVKPVPVLPCTAVVANKPHNDAAHESSNLSVESSVLSAPSLPYAQTMVQLSPSFGKESLVPDGTGCAVSFLAFHPNFGVQLLSSISTYNNGSGTGNDMPAVMSISDNAANANDVRSSDGQQQSTQFMLKASDCFSASPLSRLCDVQRMDVLRASIHNKNIPDRIVACCASVSVPLKATQSMDPSASLQSVLYSCEYGAAVVSHAEAGVELSPDLLGGVSLHSVSHANVWGLSTAAMKVTKNNAVPASQLVEDAEQGLGNNDRIWPVIMTSRILNQSGLVVLNVAKQSIVDEAPQHIKIIEDKSTVSFLPIGGNGLKHSGLAVQVTSDTLRLVYLDESPEIIKNYTCTFQTETTTDMLGCATAPNPLPQENAAASKVESLEDDTVQSDSDDELSTTDDDEPAIDEAIMGDDDDCSVRSTDSTNTKHLKTREQKRRARVERVHIRSEQQAKLTNREKGRLKMILEKENRRQEKETQTAQPQTPWSIEMSGELGDHIALAGKGQLVVVRLKPPAVRMQQQQQPVAPSAPTAPAPAAGMSRNATRQFVRVKMVGEQVPFVLKYRQRLSGQIAALGSLLWQGQRIIACSYWGEEIIDIFMCPEELNLPVPATAADAEAAANVVQNLEKVACISLPKKSHSPGSNSNNASADSSSNFNFIQHLQLVPLASSEEIAVHDLDLAHPDVPSALSSSAAHVTTADKLRNRVAATKGKSNATAPINSVFAVVGATLSGSVFIYYVYMRQKKDLSVQNWEVYFHQHHQTGKRILGIKSIDTRETNMITTKQYKASSSENHTEKASGSKEPNGSAIKIHASDGHYLLHFAAAHSPINVMAHQPGWESELKNITGNNRGGEDSDSFADLAVDVGTVHEEYEYSLGVSVNVNSHSLSDALSAAATHTHGKDETKVEEEVEEEEQDRGALKMEKRAKRVLGIRQGLLSDADQELAAAYARNKVVTEQSVSQRALLPKAIRGHCWTWIPLVIHNNGLGVGYVVQIPGFKSGEGGAYRNGGHSTSRMLLADLGFTWLLPAAENDSGKMDETNAGVSISHENDEGDASNGKTAGCIICMGAPADQPSRFYQQKRITVPGRIISIRVNEDKSKLVLAWAQEHGASISPSTSRSNATQGLCVLDAKTFECLWNTTYQRWHTPPSSLVNGNGGAALGTSNTNTAPVEDAPTAAVAINAGPVQNQGPGPALGAIRSQRAAAARLEQDKLAQGKTWRAAVDKAMQVLGSTTAFANASSGHRELDAILEGLPPVAADGSMARVPSMSDCFTTLHRTTVDVSPFLDGKTPEGLVPLPKVATCFVISVFAFAKSTSAEGTNTSPIALQALGSTGYECRGAVMATTIGASMLKHANTGSWSDSQDQSNCDASSDLQVMDSKYLIMAGESDVTVIGWKLASDISASANANGENESQEQKQVNSSSKCITLAVLCSYEIDLGCVMSITAGASHDRSCKLFISHVVQNSDSSSSTGTGSGLRRGGNVHIDPSKTGLAPLITILTLSIDAYGKLSINAERSVSMPGGPVSHLAPTSVIFPSSMSNEVQSQGGSGNDAGVGIDQSLSERGVSVSAIDQATASIVTAHFHLEKEKIHTNSTATTTTLTSTFSALALRSKDTTLRSTGHTGPTGPTGLGEDSSDDEITVPIKKAADMRGGATFKVNTAVPQYHNMDFHTHTSAAGKVMENEAVADKKESFSLEEASVGLQHHPLPEGLLSSQVLFHQSVAAIATPVTTHKAKVGSGTDRGKGEREIGLLWALLDSRLDWHMRGEQPTKM